MKECEHKSLTYRRENTAMLLRYFQAMTPINAVSDENVIRD